MRIALAVDLSTIVANAATLSSVLKHSSPEDAFVVYILHDGSLGEAEQQVFKEFENTHPRQIKISFIAVADSHELGQRLFPRSERLSSCGYLSLFIPMYLSGQERVLYIDSTVMVGTDIRRFYETDMGDRWFAGAIDADATAAAQLLGLESSAAYLDGGMLLWNIAQIPPSFLDEVIEGLGRGGRAYQTVDFQDAINCIFADKLLACFGKWHSIQKEACAVLATDDAALLPGKRGADNFWAIHFIRSKPWRNCIVPFYRQWIDCFQDSPAHQYYPLKKHTHYSIFLEKNYHSVKAYFAGVYNRRLRSIVLFICDFVFKKNNEFIRNIRDALFVANAKKNSKCKFSVDDIIAKDGPVLTFERNMLYNGIYGIKSTYYSLFKTRCIEHYDSGFNKKFHTVFFNVFRNSGIKKHIALLLHRLVCDFTILFVECGFLQSVTNVNDENIPFKYRKVNSYIIDDMGFYFDALTPSRIEAYLNSDESKLSPSQTERINSVINKIRVHKITKYNYQPIDIPAVLKTKNEKILVIDQSKKDASITRGMANDATFARMLEAALSENPDADIFIKTHPDSIARQRGCYYAKVKCEGRVHKITEVVNPYSVLEAVDKVYVCTSQLGFEALIAGKSVSVFGMPAYAGWGLTDDRLTLDRRMRNHSLEELVYALLIKYSVYFHPLSGERCEIEDFIDAMVELRHEYFEKFSGVQWNCSR